jgi:SDR family mycofactocin-dependent oxidoreductase
MGLLDGKVAVITGAARGQGRAHAIRFAEEGADIIAMDICRDVETVPYPGARAEDLEETVAAVEKLDRRIIATETDVRDGGAVTEAVDKGVAELGHLDIVVANAGITSYVRAEEMSEDSWSTMIATNLTGVWHVTRAAMPHLMQGGRGGSIVLTSSSAAHIGLPNLSHYSAAKGGIVGLMQSLAVELGPHMIRVNTIHPTTVRTPMALNQATYDLFLPGAGLSADSPADEEKVAEAFKGLNAMPIPWIEPEDIANAAIFLSSEMGRYISGTQLRVDAGSAVR